MWLLSSMTVACNILTSSIALSEAQQFSEWSELKFFKTCRVCCSFYMFVTWIKRRVHSFLPDVIVLSHSSFVLFYCFSLYLNAYCRMSPEQSFYSHVFFCSFYLEIVMNLQKLSFLNNFLCLEFSIFDFVISSYIVILCHFSQNSCINYIKNVKNVNNSTQCVFGIGTNYSHGMRQWDIPSLCCSHRLDTSN